MFASCGNFRGLNCPFYALGSGTCRRPYCHFRHVRNHAETERPQSSKPKGSIDDVYPQTADVGNCVVKAAPPPVSLPTQEPTKDVPVQYVPTPIAQIALARRRHKMAARTSRKGCKKASTPTYVPTPLAQIAAPPETDITLNKYRLTESQGEESDETGYDPLKTKLLRDVGLMSGKYSLAHDLPAGKDEYDPLESDNLLTPGKRRKTSSGNALQIDHPDDPDSVSEDVDGSSEPEGSQLNVASSKYRLQAPSKHVSNLVYDPLDNSAYNQNLVHRKTRKSLEKKNIQSTSIHGKEATMAKPIEDDGLYDFDEPGIDANGANEYDPVQNDENMSSHEPANYTPTTKYSMRNDHSEPGNESEYDPLSNFFSEETLEKHRLPKNRKDFPQFDNGESSDSEGLIIDETENKRKELSSDEKPAPKKQKRIETELTCSSEEGPGKAWLTDVAQGSFLADVSFHPLSDTEITFTPSYSYNPVDTHRDDSCDSGEQDWNPTEYLTHLSTTRNTEDNAAESNKAQPSQAALVGKKAATRERKSKGSQGSGKGSAKSKIKKPVDTSKAKDSGSEKQNVGVKNAASSKVNKTVEATDKQGQVNDGISNLTEKTEEKPNPKVSSDQLSNFFNKINEKNKKAKSNTDNQKRKQMVKKPFKQSKENPVPKISSAIQNMSGNLTEKPKTCEQNMSTGNKQDSNDVTGLHEPSKNYNVIVIDSSSSSEDNLTRQPQNSKISQNSQVVSLDKRNPSPRLGHRKASTQLLFGDDSDSDTSDVQMLRQSDDEILLISDGCSSTGEKGKTNGGKDRSTKEQHNPTSPSKQHKNGGNKSLNKRSTDPSKKSDNKKEKSLDSTQRRNGKKTTNESHSKPDNCNKKFIDKRKPSDEDKVRDSKPRYQKTPSVQHRRPHSLPNVLNTVIKRDASSNDVADDYGVDRVYSSDNDTALSDCDINDTDISFSESDTFEECLRIFQEDNLNVPVRKPQKLQKFKEPEQPKKEDLILSTGKQRVAHVSRLTSFKHKKCTPRPKTRPSPLQVCHNRYIQAQEQYHEQHHQDAYRQPTTESAAWNPATGGSKKRIAHVPELQSRPNRPNRSLPPVMGINAKIQMKYSFGHSASSDTAGKTVAITAPKGERRLAHLPKKVNPRPVIPPDAAGKVPSNIRQRYLNVFIDEFLKSTQSEQDAFEQGLKEEKCVYDRATSKNIYLNLSVNTLKRLRTAQSPNQTKVTSPTSKAGISHEAIIGGKPATQHTYTLNRSHINRLPAQDKYEGAFLYERLKPYLLSEDELFANGYPRPSETPGIAIVKGDDNKKSASADSNQHICSRCGKTFLRRPDGHYITRENCNFHWGKFWHNKVGGSVEGRFNCCSGTSDAKGCCIAKYHVTEDKTSNLTGFMKTVVKSPPYHGNPGLYAIDCEMCYTVKALELTRVTVIDDKLTCVYDTLVKPSVEIVDYNTRFSGITEDDLKCVHTTIQDVQAVLLSMFSSDSILIGHSLESDLLALKMIHSTVIDTAVLFPHRRGLPFKRALRTLMAECLNRIIQNDVGGHDSQEDARSCMELMIWKAKQDAKKKKPR